MKKFSKRGQLTLFLVLAILIVGGIVGFFVYRGYFSKIGVPNMAKPVYSAYLSCIEQLTKEGASILSSRGGYIEIPEFEPGSPFMPSSSQLDLLGVGIPYWFYISGNNLVREQVPTKRGMEIQLQKYIQDNLQSCDFSDFETRGYLIDVDEGSVNVKIEENQIQVNVKNEMRIGFEDDFYRFAEHKLSVRSKLGKFYDLARKIYDHQTKENFLDNYALDTLMLHAPTSGFEEGCTPIIFNFNEIRNNLSQALSTNIASVRIKGNYYSNVDEYFVVDVGVNINENVNFVYSNQWPTKIEIYGEEFAEPVGLQEGMAILGFCFVEYELIYDVVFPVLVQIYDEKESFQFPVIIHLRRNQIADDLIDRSYFGEEEIVCKNRNQNMKISIVDLDGVPIKATVSFSCLGERCYLGESNTLGVLQTNVPMCVNGFIEARAEGYAIGRYMVSSNEKNHANVLMKKIYSLDLNLGGIPGEALVQFISDDFSKSVLYPQSRQIQLTEGIYDVKVQVFKNSSLTFPARNEKKCFETPSLGLSQIIGGRETQCYDINIPAQEIERVLIGGGNSVELISGNSLANSRAVLIDVPTFDIPLTIEQINENYIKLEDSFLSVSFTK